MNNYGALILLVGFVLVIIGLSLMALVGYKHESRCPKCKRNYAMEEYKNPNVREVDTSEGTRRTTTRFLKCKYCGHEDTITEKKLIPYEE